MNKEALYQQFARIGHAVSHPHRLRILNALCQAEKTVEALAERTGQSVAATSAHLKVLRSACLVETRKEWRNVYYRLATEGVAHVWLALQRLGAEVLPEVQAVVKTHLTDPGAMVEMSGSDLLEQVREGTITLIDLRSSDEYDAGHFPGARSIPLDVLDDLMTQLPKDRRLIAYCRGPYCLATVAAIKKLRQAGLDAKGLRMGIVEWRAEGLPVELHKAS
ncbi:MAG: metalloregulator ArsR/SmtB family transcription factor [Rhizobiaceae bacterium]|nr:MAG: metalloregulator ArsR/SmtB family transcription factor [Rhizobiaceae bacterium]